ncbi:MAG: hypothetical protein J0J01_24110 [Reyranella sp.]|uniref:hypothetical protein n=1 Tax=Reyranella sp. TaxID=1929291 RepID=UPI001ACE0C1B|nr:hypothetical protein [Reyranella sp.]MBN9090007.1 hypothetical protein [Reyranella sp.]
MARSPKQEARALAADERALVDKSRPAVVRSLADSELAGLVKLTRTRRDRARTVAERQRREMRGKAPARGAAPSKANEGTRLKLSVLTEALRRLDSEAKRRRRDKAKTSLVASAKKALALKQKAKRAAPSPPTARSASAGLRGKARIEVETHVPPSARGRVRKQVARAQAKRDSKPR